MLVYFALDDAHFSRHPRQNPNASQWNIGCVGPKHKSLALAMYISFCLCRFHLRWVANTNPISSGIWALTYQSFSFDRKRWRSLKMSARSCTPRSRTSVKRRPTWRRSTATPNGRRTRQSSHSGTPRLVGGYLQGHNSPEKL